VNGLGIDFGASALRAAFWGDSGCSVVPELTIDPRANTFVEWTSIGPTPAPVLWTSKWALGAPEERFRFRAGEAAELEERVRRRLRDLREAVEERYESRVVGATLAVPPGFGVHQRARVRALAAEAGFGDLSLVDDTVAAVWGAATGPGRAGTVLVFSLGKTSFCATLVASDGNEFSVIGHETTQEVSGDAIDGRLAAAMMHRLSREEAGIRWDARDALLLAGVAEEARIHLSRPGEDRFERAFRTEDGAGARGLFRWSVDRRSLESILTPFADHAVELALRACRDADTAAETLGEVLLLGRVCETPFLQERIRAAFPRPMRALPLDAVAKGSAWLASAERVCLEPLTEPAAAARGRSAPAFAIGAGNAPATGERSGAETDRREPAAKALSSSRTLLDPEEPLLRTLAAARIEEAAGNTEQAIAAYERFLGLAREQFSYLLSRRASELEEAGRALEAERLLEKGLRLAPEAAHLRAKLSKHYLARALDRMRKHDLRETVEWCRRSLEFDPGNAEAGSLLETLEQRKRQRRPHTRGGRN
jgi:tetratricopeptide (TPR) repeat protein